MKEEKDLMRHLDGGGGAGSVWPRWRGEGGGTLSVREDFARNGTWGKRLDPSRITRGGLSLISEKTKIGLRIRYPKYGGKMNRRYSSQW